MQRKPLADPEGIFVDALEHAEPEFLACREMAHRWTVSSGFQLIDAEREPDRQPRGGYRSYAERRLTCQRCGMIRSDAFAISTTMYGHTSLQKISSSYTQPDGYAIPGIGNARGMRDLLYGVAFDAATARKGRRS